MEHKDLTVDKMSPIFFLKYDICIFLTPVYKLNKIAKKNFMKNTSTYIALLMLK